MALTATYDPVLSRIRLAGTGLGATGTTVMVTRSTNNWLSSEVVRGGFNAPYSGGSFTVDDYEFPAGVPLQYRMVTLDGSHFASITQDIDGVWLKVPAAPFLNRQVTVVRAGDISRPARRNSLAIIARNNPVVMTDVRSSIQFDLQIRTETPEEEEELELLLSTGEILFFHLPSGNHCMRGGYYDAGDIVWGPPSSRAAPARVFNIPLFGAAAPGPDVVGSTYTWNAVLNDYATWSDLVAANATWNDLLQRTADPTDVIVP
jgi:hypothetical protein